MYHSGAISGKDKIVCGMEWKSSGGVLIKHAGSKASSGNTTCSDQVFLAGTQECLHGA